MANDSTQGTLKWKFKTGDKIDSSSAIGFDGTIYGGSNDGYLYAINSSLKGLANSSQPMFMRNINHNGYKNLPDLIIESLKANPTHGNSLLTVNLTVYLEVISKIFNYNVVKYEWDLGL